MTKLANRFSMAANETVPIPTWGRKLIIAGMLLLIAVALAAMVWTETGGMIP